MTRRAACVAMILALAGCSRPPLTRAQAAGVERVVNTCTAASAALGPRLKAGDRSGAEQAALGARNICSQGRAMIANMVGDRLSECRAAVTLQQAMQSAELKALNGDMAPAAVVAVLDRAIVAEGQCAAALKAAG